MVSMKANLHMRVDYVQRDTSVECHASSVHGCVMYLLEEKDLGVLISHNLSWHNDIMAKVNIANKVLRLIKAVVWPRET